MSLPPRVRLDDELGRAEPPLFFGRELPPAFPAPRVLRSCPFPDAAPRALVDFVATNFTD